MISQQSHPSSTVSDGQASSIHVSDTALGKLGLSSRVTRWRRFLWPHCAGIIVGICGNHPQMAQHWTRAGSENWWPNISGFCEIFEFAQINQVAGCREIETDTPYTIRVVDGQNLKPMVSGFDFPWEANPMTWDTLRYYVAIWENTWEYMNMSYMFTSYQFMMEHDGTMESRIPKWPKRWAGPGSEKMRQP